MEIVDYIEDLQARGQYWFSYQTVAAATGKTPKSIERALSRLRQKSAIASPKKGFYIVLPPEYRRAGCLPANWFIDSLMRFSNEEYYVGLLSAAELFGAAHHHPQEMQVVTQRPHRKLECGRTRIRYFSKRDVKQTPTALHKTRTGYIRLSTPEATALDLVRYSFELGGLDTIAVILSELREKMKSRDLVEAASTFEMAVVQRLGFLLDVVGAEQLGHSLCKWVNAQRPRLTLLQPGRPDNESHIDERWRLKINEVISLDE
jgi:predicted transcriptional regulator of viral defense system